MGGCDVTFWDARRALGGRGRGDHAGGCDRRLGRRCAGELSRGRPAGRHRQGDQGRRRRHRLQRPDRRHPRRPRSTASRRTSTTSTRRGRGLRPQARARLRSATTASRTTASEVQGLLTKDDVFAVLPVAVAAVHRRRPARQGEDPDLRLGHQRGVGLGGPQARAGELLRAGRRSICFTCAESELRRRGCRKKLASSASASSRSTCRSPTACADGLENELQEVPDRRRSCSWTRASRSAPRTTARRSRR